MDEKDILTIVGRRKDSRIGHNILLTTRRIEVKLEVTTGFVQKNNRFAK